MTIVPRTVNPAPRRSSTSVYPSTPRLLAGARLLFAAGRLLLPPTMPLELLALALLVLLLALVADRSSRPGCRLSVSAGVLLRLAET